MRANFTQENIEGMKAFDPELSGRLRSPWTTSCRSISSSWRSLRRRFRGC